MELRQIRFIGVACEELRLSALLTFSDILRAAQCVARRDCIFVRWLTNVWCQTRRSFVVECVVQRSQSRDYRGLSEQDQAAHGTLAKPIMAHFLKFSICPAPIGANRQ